MQLTLQGQDALSVNFLLSSGLCLQLLDVGLLAVDCLLEGGD